MFKHRLNEYVCAFCGFKSTLRGAVTLHLKSIHKDILDSDRNDYVEEEFDDLSNEILDFDSFLSNVNQKRRIDADKELFVCGSCYFISKNRDYMKKHFDKDHKYFINQTIVFSNNQFYLDVVKNSWCLNRKQCAKCSFIGEKSSDLTKHFTKFHNVDQQQNEEYLFEVKKEDESCPVSSSTKHFSSFETKCIKSGRINSSKVYRCPFCSCNKKSRFQMKKHLENHLDSESKFKRAKQERELNNVLDELKQCVVKAVNLINRIEKM